MVTNGVQILGSNKAVESLNESIVENEHDCGRPPCPFLAPEE